MSNFISGLQNKSPRARFFIAVAMTVLIMTAILYIWFNSFRNSLSGSFEVKNQANVSQQIESQKYEKSFFGSLSGFFEDIDIDVSRLSDLKKSAKGLFGEFSNSLADE
ncbi:hypothetical protein C4553_02555 [Candidatus Parcubacteria bacterium]|nr:MAG: hypothetical protein C4553_02555 [Candidatus Parcubacteria bacterium]